MRNEHKMIFIIMFSSMMLPLAMFYSDDSEVFTELDNSFPILLLFSVVLGAILLVYFNSYRSLLKAIQRINSSLISAESDKFKLLDVDNKSESVSDLISSINDLMFRYMKEIEIITDKNYIDSTTYLPNKRWLNERCEHVSFGAFILLQVESVNSVAESLKFDEYEVFIREISNALSNIIGEEVVIVRVDSDKYALGLDSEFNIDYVIGKIKTLESTTFDICSHAIYVEFLFGTSSAMHDSHTTASDLLDDAKLALCEAKRRRAKHAHFNSSMRHHNSEKIKAYNRLKNAVENDEFIPYFQPIIDLENGAIVGVEALARWNDPEKGIVGPYAFIELAEDTGLIDLIGLSIFNKSLRWYQKNQGQIPNPFTIHVNISIRQLMSVHFVDDVKRILAEVDYLHHNVCFEFTESIYMESKQVIDNLVELRALGISFAIDDFGTGYSSFSYLRDLDFTSLKIDKSFVSEENVELLKAMITMGRSLGCEVIAEGVETQEQCAILRQLECPMVQGYLFSMPLPEDEFTDFVASKNEQEIMSSF